MVSSLSKLELAHQLKEIRAPRPTLVNDEGGESPFIMDPDEAERTTSDLNTEKRRVEMRAPSAYSRSDDRAPNVESIMMENWGACSGSGTKQSFWDPSLNFSNHNKLYNWLEPDAERFQGVATMSRVSLRVSSH
ncbi:hypothetical protein ACSQ67_020678 [Phaseolus vulgaris]